MKNRRLLIWFLLFVPASITVYIFFAVFFSFVPVNKDFQETENGVEVFVRTNGVHTDLILPVETKIIDWRTKLNPEKFIASNIRFIAFGWGDKGFYMNTPEWSDLKFSTAFKALFWLGTSAVHVTYYTRNILKSDRVVRLRISEVQYLRLVHFIDASFQKLDGNKYQLINCCDYEGINDEFYEGVGVYNLFTTCNTWTSQGLKQAGIRTALWAPFDWSVMHHLESEKKGRLTE